MVSAAGPAAVCEGCTIGDRRRSCRAAAPCGGSCASGLTDTGAIRTSDPGAITGTAPVAKATPVPETASVAKAIPVAEAPPVAKATTLPGAEVRLLRAAAELVACSTAIRTIPLETIPYRITAVGHPLTMRSIVLPSVADVPRPGAVDSPCPVYVDIDVAAAPAKAGPAPQRANKGDPAREGHAGQEGAANTHPTGGG
jgi:hypothetical protein